jgi:hypothetical protein
MNNTENVCIDKKNDNSYITHCFNENILFAFNRKRGMVAYRDPISNLFCVTFDNSSVMGRFYKNVQDMAKNDVIALLQKYVEKQIRSYYYPNQNTGMPSLKVFYDVGDLIRSKSSTGNFILDGKFFVNNVGPFGECTKTRAVQFLQPLERVSCGYKIVKA